MNDFYDPNDKEQFYSQADDKYDLWTIAIVLELVFMLAYILCEF
jgi:hypothetical protein